MRKLINSIQHYAWGSKTALTERYGVANPDDLPMAELWMGAHPKSSSKVQDSHGNAHSLRDLIADNKEKLLGNAVAGRFGELPFLFKVLCAAQPLSIQTHPDKTSAAIGFARENAAAIPLDAPERNYKDPNHKPELIFALTPFLAMNAFREFSSMASLLRPVASAHPAIAHFLEQPDTQRLSHLFACLLKMQGAEKAHALEVLKSALASQQGEPWQTIRLIAGCYPDDSGLFSPLLLNVVTLNPGEAMFLFAKTPHAYLHGVALEVMANSDNVLRAGLTPKYIDIEELVASIDFVAKPAPELLTLPDKNGAELNFPVPVDDFAFSVYTLEARENALTGPGAAILFCIEGEATLRQGSHSLVLRAGESAFTGADEAPLSISGSGRLARVYNKLSG